jgi:diguanylate cyclase (GGDEF)-like protein
VRHADGTLHDTIFHKAVFSDPEGGTRGIVGAMLDVTESNELARKLERLASTDPLTGVMNRRHFIELAEKEMARVKRYGGEASLLMLDLDHFKRINDTHGHAVGDEALKAVCRASQGALREGDLLGRFGGEEFAILLPQTPLLRGVEVAERLRKVLAERPIQAGGPTLHLTASFGVAALLPEDKGIDPVIERADLALYKAKENGRNRVEVGAVLRP